MESSKKGTIKFDHGAERFINGVTQAAAIHSAQSSAVGEKGLIWRAEPTEFAQETMNAAGREEIDLKLEAIELRMDNRVTRIEGKIDTMLARMDEREKSAELRFGRIESDLRDIRSETKNFKWWLIGLVVPTGIAVVFGIGAFNATLLSNMVASFESGKNTGASIIQATEQLKQTQEQLMRIQARLDRQASK